MDLWISSYEKNIYKLKINKGCTKVKEIEEKKITCYPSYICKYGNKIAVALKKNDGEKTAGIIILNNKMENIFEFYNEVSYTHVYIDNKYILAGSYHEGEILIINQKNKNIDIKKYENSKIHNVGKLSKNKYYAVDLENAKIYIFKIIEGKYQEIETIKIDNNKPRHLIVNKKRIYVLCEDTSNILYSKLPENINKHINLIRMANGTLTVDCKGFFIGKIKLQGTKHNMLILTSLYASYVVEDNFIEHIDEWIKYINDYIIKDL